MLRRDGRRVGRVERFRRRWLRAAQHTDGIQREMDGKEGQAGRIATAFSAVNRGNRREHKAQERDFHAFFLPVFLSSAHACLPCRLSVLFCLADAYACL